MTSDPTHLQKTSLLPWSTWENVHGILKFRMKNNIVPIFRNLWFFKSDEKFCTIFARQFIFSEFNFQGQNDTIDSERTVKTLTFCLKNLKINKPNFKIFSPTPFSGSCLSGTPFIRHYLFMRRVFAPLKNSSKELKDLRKICQKNFQTFQTINNRFTNPFTNISRNRKFWKANNITYKERNKQTLKFLNRDCEP